MATYQVIVDQIRDAANVALNGQGRFMHGRIVDASRDFNGAYPFIVLYPFTIRTGDGSDNDSVDTTTILLGFWQQDGPDTTEVQREAIISEMDDLSDLFIEEIRDSSNFRISTVDKEPAYQFYQGTLSGFAMRFQLQVMQPC